MSSSISPKGKGKATGDGSGSDSDDNFFVYKRPIPTKPVKLLQKLPPAPVRAASSSEYESTDSDNPTAKKRKKRKRAKHKPEPIPEWLEIAEAAKGRANSRSTTREGSSARAPMIEINDSDNEEEILRRKKQRAVIAITPPPTLSEEQMAKVFGVVEKFVTQIPDTEEQDNSNTPARAPRAATPDGFQPDEIVNVVISMVADPERRQSGHSEKAIQRYEKPRTLLINRRDPFSRMMNDWAHTQSKEVSELVIEYNGAKLSGYMSPLRLGIQPKAEIRLLSYETAVYEKIVNQREEERERRMAGETEENKAEEEEEAGGDENEEPAEEEKKGTILRLRGSWGEANMRVMDDVLIRKLAVFYCKKVGQGGREDEVELSFDGEKLDGGTSVGELGVEDRDMIDVRCPPV